MTRGSCMEEWKVKVSDFFPGINPIFKVEGGTVLIKQTKEGECIRHNVMLLENAKQQFIKLIKCVEGDYLQRCANMEDTTNQLLAIKDLCTYLDKLYKEAFKNDI